MPDAAVTYCADCYQAVQDCDSAVVVTEWSEFRELDWLRVRRMMRTPLLLDGRNLCRPAKMAALAFRYRGIGRPGTWWMPDGRAPRPSNTPECAEGSIGEARQRQAHAMAATTTHWD